MPDPLHFDRSWSFAVPPERFWAAISDTARYPEWWTWLRDYEAEGLEEGDRARFAVQPPLPYRLRFQLEVELVEPCRLVAVQVGGDIVGPARLELAPTADGCTARLAWRLHVRRPVLRSLSWAVRPLLSWGHDHVVEVGVRQFREGALGLPPDGA